MDLTIGWTEIGWRLAAALFAGTVIGINRGERGRAAGLRTNALVCLAACIAMIEVNLLLSTSGKVGASFATMDVMHLPAAMLTGMGFIGAGAILRRSELVVGVTTAATLWFVTVIGLCMGGGQIRLGLEGVTLGFVVLWLFQFLERRIPQDRMGTFVVAAGLDGPAEDDVRTLIAAAGYRIGSFSLTYEPAVQQRKFVCEIHWRARPGDTQTPSFINQLAKAGGVAQIEWTQPAHS